MATTPVKLAVDRQLKALTQLPGFAISIPDQFQSNTVDFEIQVVDTPGISAPATPIDMGAYGMRISVGDTPTGASGGPTPLALATLTWNAATVTTAPSRFIGSLALNTAAVDTFLGTAATRAAYFEVNLTISGTRITIFQGTFNLKAVVDEGTSTVPTPTDSYMTKNECLATFLKKVEDAGVVWHATSPDGSWGLELGVDNNGSVIMNAVKLT